VPEFPGKIRLMEDPLDAVKADIDVSDGCLALIVSDREIGEWRLDEVAIEVTFDGFLMRVDGEEFVFATTQTAEFARAVGMGTDRKGSTATKSRGNRRPDGSASKQRRPAKPKEPSAPSPLQTWLSNLDLSDPKTRVAIGALLVAVFMAVVARPLLAGLLLLAGMAGGVIAGAAMVDPVLASRLPTGLTYVRLIIAALVALTVGMLLIAF
jgi:hypothetical protein